ncbi:GNAT superfamily N-acetyltransferase [Arthrobacter bambusae]|uniref:GNAT superfamily N-acetyltransferase n=2 Tax=Micrococcales TaxID=85006 RepID=A0ABV2P736_9MICC
MLAYSLYMSPDALVEDIAHLLEVWVAGWSGCRGYESRQEGRFPAALRADKTGDWEYFAHDPSDEEFTTLAGKTAEAPTRILTVLTNDVQRYKYLAEQHGLTVTSASQTMMIVDMETQDSEDPWLPDDDLELATSESNGVHYAVVHSGEQVAASGRVFVVDGTAVFDKIVTEPDFQRRGLGSFIMKALAAQAFSHDVENGLLLASLDGQKLYSHLGWDVVGHVLMMSASGTEGSDLSGA